MWFGEVNDILQSYWEGEGSLNGDFLEEPEGVATWVGEVMCPLAYTPRDSRENKFKWVNNFLYLCLLLPVSC